MNAFEDMANCAKYKNASKCIVQAIIGYKSGYKTCLLGLSIHFIYGNNKYPTRTEMEKWTKDKGTQQKAKDIGNNVLDGF